MPVKPVKGLKRKGFTGHLSKWQKIKLISGDGFGWLDDVFTSEEEKEAWILHRDKLLSEYIQQRPGYRPVAFWIFDHKYDSKMLSEVVLFTFKKQRPTMQDRFRSVMIWIFCLKKSEKIAI